MNLAEAESSQLPTINGFIKGDPSANLAFLQSSEWISEAHIAAACQSVKGAISWADVARAAKSRSAEDEDGSLAPTAVGLAEGLMDKSFWAMQALGLPPVSGAFSGYRRLRLEHDQEDYEFASCMRFWYLFMLLVPGILHFSLHSFGYFRFPLENAERMENCP